MSSSVVGADTVYLEQPTNQNHIQQPTVTEQQKLSGEEPAIVEAKWEIKEFVWYSRFLDDLPKVYEALLKRLDVDPDDYACDIEGFHCYRHDYDSNRKCDVDRIFVPLVRAGKYHPYSSVKHRRRASSRTLDRLEFLDEECRHRRVKFDYMVKIDLTFPKGVSLAWDNADVQIQIRECVKDFLSELNDELFPGHNSQFGVICNHHYWATKTPLEPHRHIHLTLPNVTYNKNTGMFHRFRPYLDDDLVRSVWKNVLVEDGLFDGSGNVDVWVNYIKFEKRGKVLHRLSYCSRKPIEDMVRASKSDYGFCAVVEVGEFDRDFALFLLDYTPRIVNLGFLCNLKRFGYSRKPATLKCPVCGGDMHLQRDDYGNPFLYDRPPPDILSLYRTRKGEWTDILSSDDFVGGDMNG